ncbi:MAG: Ig-like domain-containing protein [Clostridia bacterium]|nr:Ig-like domain-containing protein [Clostridia bacterium]
MNILIIANKSDLKIYNTVFKTVPNTTVLGAVTRVNSNFISVLRDKYNPHVVVIDTDVCCKNTSIRQLLNDILRYPYMKTLVITDADDQYDYPATRVIRGQVSNIALKEALSQLNSNSNLKKNNSSDIKNCFVDKLSTKQNIKSVKFRTKKKLNPIIIAVISAVVLAGAVITAVIVKNNSLSTYNDNSTVATVDELFEISIDADDTEGTTAIATVAPPSAKSRDRTQTVADPDDKSRIKHNNSVKSNENKNESDKSDNKSKSSSNHDDNADVETNNNNQSNGSYNNDNNTDYDNYIEYGSASVSYGNGNYRNSHDNSVSSVKLSYKSKTLRIGDTLTISAYVSPSSAPQSVSWSSSNSNIVSVDTHGNLTAHHNGAADITATADNGKFATCRVTVNGSSYDNNVRLSVTSYNLAIGESLTVTLYNSSNCQWSFSDSVVKKLYGSNNSITICGKKRGNTDLTVIDKNTGIKYVCKINVR